MYVCVLFFARTLCAALRDTYEQDRLSQREAERERSQRETAYELDTDKVILLVIFDHNAAQLNVATKQLIAPQHLEAN